MIGFSVFGFQFSVKKKKTGGAGVSPACKKLVAQASRLCFEGRSYC
jgi:hypothetical protein